MCLLGVSMSFYSPYIMSYIPEGTTERIVKEGPYSPWPSGLQGLMVGSGSSLC